MNRIPSNTSAGWSLSGQLLVATPKLTDPLFGRSVCLVVEHSEEGVAAVVLNRPVTGDIQGLWEQLSAGSSAVSEAPRHVHFGGPVSGPVVAIHDQEKLADAGNGQGVYLAAQVDTLRKLVDVAPEHFRLFIGHATWELGKIADEIRKGMWYVVPAVPELVFSADDEMWGRSIRRVGGMVMQYVTGIRELPPNPSWN